MLVKIGRHRFNLLNVTDIAEGCVFFTNSRYLQLNEAEMTALTVFWDGHGEEINAQPELNAQPAVNTTSKNGGRDFELGGATT